MKKLAIIGSGDLGQQIAHYAICDNHYGEVVFIDDFNQEKSNNGIKIIGNTSSIVNLYTNNYFDELIIGIGYKHLEKRKELFELFLNKIPFGTIVHSSSWIDETAMVKKGCVIYPFCYIDVNAVIEENCIVNIGCTLAHDTIVGKHCFLSPRVAIAGFVNIQEQISIGINATIIDNITIKEKTQIGAGAVIIKNIEVSGLYVGNPARFIR
jgi:sugar O-acyltransferase (sialic acid O-acetyltransferase NeuD family)